MWQLVAVPVPGSWICGKKSSGSWKHFGKSSNIQKHKCLRRSGPSSPLLLNLPINHQLPLLCRRHLWCRWRLLRRCRRCLNPWGRAMAATPRGQWHPWHPWHPWNRAIHSLGGEWIRWEQRNWWLWESSRPKSEIAVLLKTWDPEMEWTFSESNSIEPYLFKQVIKAIGTSFLGTQFWPPDVWSRWAIAGAVCP